MAAGRRRYRRRERVEHGKHGLVAEPVRRVSDDSMVVPPIGLPLVEPESGSPRSVYACTPGRVSASRNPDQRSVTRSAAAPTLSSDPYTTTRRRARVTAV